jgi:sulfur carrier protein ThiS
MFTLIQIKDPMNGRAEVVPEFVPCGQTLHQLTESKKEAGVIVMVNGQIISRKQFGYKPRENDTVQLISIPMGPSIPIIWYVVAAIVLVAAVSLMHNTPAQNNRSSESSPTFSVNAAGNAARLNEAIPVPYGRHIMAPDFATQTYTKFDSNGDMFYYAIFSLGMFEKAIVESVMIDDTPITHFTDVDIQYFGPSFSSSQTLVNPAVVTAPEVSNNVLKYGVASGPFTACGQGLTVNSIGLDINFPKGLYNSNDQGDYLNRTVKVQFEKREVNDVGAPLSAWSLLGIETMTHAKADNVRHTFEYTVTPGRYEVRATRITGESSDSRTGDEMQWYAMRGYLDDIEDLPTGVNFMAVRMKANEQLNGTSERRFTVILRRMLKIWNPSTGWSDYTYTRSPAWAIADIIKNEQYGLGLPDSRIDLLTLFQLASLWADRGDEFNYIFDKRVTAWGAIQTAAKVGRTLAMSRGNVITFVRDSKQTLPVAMFTEFNSADLKIEYKQVTEDPPDSVELEYFSSKTWASAWVTVPIPGALTNNLNPLRIKIDGITTEKHAMREALFIAADTAYRTTPISFNTELEAYLPSRGNLIMVSHDIMGYDYNGLIIEIDGLVAYTNTRLDFGTGNHYVIINDKLGNVHGPFLVNEGPTDTSFTFSTAPTFEIKTDLNSELHRFSFGQAESYAERCVIKSIEPADGFTAGIVAIVEDDRVHDADLAYIDGSGGGATGYLGKTAVYMADTAPLFDNATAAQKEHAGYYTRGDMTTGIHNEEGYCYAA